MEISAAAIAVIGITMSPQNLSWITVLLGWCLLFIAFYDIFYFIIPDRVTMPLTVFGIFFSTYLLENDFYLHLTGAAIGYLIFYAIAVLYRIVRNRVGLGLGDAKLFAAAGAWLGFEELPEILLIASVAGIVMCPLFISSGRTIMTTRIPFGCFLAAGFWIVWIMSTSQIPAPRLHP